MKLIFFFQAEDGIRDADVTGVQTCALPILASTCAPAGVSGHLSRPSGTPSLSVSMGQPRSSTLAPTGVSGHLSLESTTPSWSESFTGRPSSKKETPTVPAQCVADEAKDDCVLGV